MPGGTATSQFNPCGGGEMDTDWFQCWLVVVARCGTCKPEVGTSTGGVPVMVSVVDRIPGVKALLPL
jgi:hypothetical protein